MRVISDMPKSHEREAEQVHLLVVDNQATVRDGLAAIFAGEPGFSVSQAGSLKDARTMLEGVDIAILGLGLPDGHGVELVRDLYAASPDAQVLVLTSSIDPVQAERALQSGAAPS
jgi:DNA-binding NarL/FixJ family response regulator